MNNHRFTMHDGKRPEDLSIQVVEKGMLTGSWLNKSEK